MRRRYIEIVTWQIANLRERYNEIAHRPGIGIDDRRMSLEE